MNLKITVLNCLGSLSYTTVGAAFAWPSPTLPKLLSGEAPLLLDVNEASWVVSLFFLGNLVSPIPSGYLADKFGRQKTWVWSGLFPIISWILVIFSTDVVGLYIARFLIGLHLGIISTINPMYVGEISQPDIRGSLNSINSLASNTGMLYVFLVGPYVSYHTLAWLCLVAPLCFFFSFLLLAPETPFYIMKKAGPEKAKTSLLWLRGGLNDINVEVELENVRKMVETKNCNEGYVKEIFESRVARKSLIIGLVYSAAKRLSGDGLIRAHSTVTLPEKTFNVLTPNGCALILGFVTIFTSLLSTCLSDSFGRKTLTIVSCLGCALSNSTVAVWFFLDLKTNLDLSSVNFVPFLGFVAHAFTYSLGCENMVSQVKSEMFPTHLKSKLSATCTVMQAVTSFVLHKFYLLVAHWEGVYLNFLIYSVSCYMTVLFIAVYIPETRGKTLQEIQDDLSEEPQKPKEKDTG